MSDWISREDALKLFPDSPRPWPAHAIRAVIRALPAVQPAREAVAVDTMEEEPPILAYIKQKVTDA